MPLPCAASSASGSSMLKSSRRLSFHRSAEDRFAKSLAFQILHSDEGLALVLPDFVNDADIRMVQRRRGTGFAAKTLKRCLVADHVVRKELQRYEARVVSSAL